MLVIFEYSFYIVAAVLAALKIAGLYAGSWVLILGIAAIPLAIAAVLFMITGIIFALATRR